MALTLQTSTGYLDLYADESISIDYNLADLRDPAVIFSPISKSFSVPATDVNNQFFKHYYDVSVSGGFNPYAKQDVTLYSDDLTMISGYLQLLDVAMDRGVPKQYQILVAGENARFARNVGEKELRELDFDSYTHTFSYEAITESWNDGLFSGEIVYAPVDTRVFASDTLFSPQQLTTPMWETDFFPSIKASIVLEQILSEAGYTIDPNIGIFDNLKFTSLYLLCYNKEGLVPLEQSFNDRLAQVYSSASLSIPELTATTPSIIQFNTEVYDNGNNFNTSTYRYQLPIVGEYKFNVQGNITSPTGVGMYQITMYLGNTAIQTKDVITMSQFSIDFVHSFMNLSTSDLVSFRIGGIDSGGTLASTCQMTVISAPDYPTGQDVNPSMFLPKMKQKDFVAGLAKMFNLVFVPSKEIPNRLNIYAYDEWIGDGAVRNWNEIVDITQPVTIKPTTELQGKSIKMLMANGNSILDNAYNSAFGIPHGSVEVDDTNNEFADSEIVIDTPFAATITNRINSNTTFEVIQMFDAEGKPIDSPPRLLYYNGLNGTSDYYIFRSADGTFQTQNEYPVFNMTYGGTFTATYGIPQVEGTKPPKNNLLTDFYATYLLELYASDAVMMEVNIVMEPSELFQLNLNDQVYYDGEYWRINKISGYDPDKMTAKVELFRASFVNSSLCASTVTALNNNGTVSFSGAATQQCCEFYGYKWSDNTCYWRTSKFVAAKSKGLVGLEKAPIANVTTHTTRPSNTQYWYEAVSDLENASVRCVPLHNYATPLFDMAEGDTQVVQIIYTCNTYSYHAEYSIVRGPTGDTIHSLRNLGPDRYHLTIELSNGFASYLQLTHTGGTQVAETWSIIAQRQQVL